MVRMKLVHCIVVFGLGWFVGCVFIVFLLMQTNTVSRGFSRNAILSKVQNRIEGGSRFADVFSKISSKASKMMRKIDAYTQSYQSGPAVTDTADRIHRIPSFDSMETINAAYKNRKLAKEQHSGNNTLNQLPIYFDWATDVTSFTGYSYLALDSVVMHNPHNPIVFLLAPFSKKAKEIVYATYFEKYCRPPYFASIRQSKRSAHLPLELQNARNRSYAAISLTAGSALKLVPYHALMFMRISHVWESGGVFSDLSYIMLGPLNAPQVTQGFHIQSYCDDGNLLNPQHTSWFKVRKEMESNDHERGSCRTSTLLVFNQAHHPVLYCTLQKYDTPDFNECLSEDSISEGALCVRSALEECFSSLEYTNDLVTLPSDKKHLILETFAGDKPDNQLSTAEDMLFRADNWTLYRTTRSVWLGRAGKSGVWGQALGGSLVSSIAVQIENGWQKHARRFDPLYGVTMTEDSMNYLRSSKGRAGDALVAQYQYRGEGEWGISTYKSFADCKPRCSRYADDHDPITAVQTMNSPFRRSCAPSLFVAGFVESGVQLLLGLLSIHPMLLAPVGSQSLYKAFNHTSNGKSATHLSGRTHRQSIISKGESRSDDRIQTSRCYAHEKVSHSYGLKHRSQCFPYIHARELSTSTDAHASEPFMAIDGSAAYSLSGWSSARHQAGHVGHGQSIENTVAQKIRADNAQAQIVFLIRHPTEALIGTLNEHIRDRIAEVKKNAADQHTVRSPHHPSEPAQTEQYERGSLQENITSPDASVNVTSMNATYFADSPGRNLMSTLSGNITVDNTSSLVPSDSLSHTRRRLLDATEVPQAGVSRGRVGGVHVGDEVLYELIIQNLETLLEEAMTEDSKYGVLRHMMNNHTANSSIVHHFYHSQIEYTSTMREILSPSTPERCAHPDVDTALKAEATPMQQLLVRCNETNQGTPVSLSATREGIEPDANIDARINAIHVKQSRSNVHLSDAAKTRLEHLTIDLLETAFSQAIAFPAIAHYADTFSPEQIILVNYEQLVSENVSLSRTCMKALLDQLGPCVANSAFDYNRFATIVTEYTGEQKRQNHVTNHADELTVNADVSEHRHGLDAAAAEVSNAARQGQPQGDPPAFGHERDGKLLDPGTYDTASASSLVAPHGAMFIPTQDLHTRLTKFFAPFIRSYATLRCDGEGTTANPQHQAGIVMEHHTNHLRGSVDGGSISEDKAASWGTSQHALLTPLVCLRGSDSVDVSQWLQRKPPTHWRKMSSKYEQYEGDLSERPLFWYEKDVDEHTQRPHEGIISKLLPHMRDQPAQDASYNTTLGLISMF